MKAAIILAILCTVATAWANEVESISGTNIQLVRLGSGRTRSGLTYWLSTAGVSWSDAEYYCSSTNRQLLMIKNDVQQKEIETYLLNTYPLPNNIWLGGYCNANRWTWIDGTPVSPIFNRLPNQSVACTGSTLTLMLFGPKASFTTRFTWKAEQALNQFICQS